MEKKPHWMFSVNCDMHPLPTDHKLYQSFEEITEGLASAMHKEREQREYNGQKSWTQQETLMEDNAPIYAMNTLIWLDFGSKEHLFDAEWHGMDHYNWYKESFMNKVGKPDVLLADDEEKEMPWTTKVDLFVESHALIFDVEKMAKIRDQYFIWDSIPSETHAIGPLANKNGWVVRRHNELHMFFDQCRYEELLNDDRYAPIAGNKEKIDEMLFLNFMLASRRRNPVEGYNIYQQYVQKNGVHMPDYYGGGFISFIWRDHYIPTFIQNSKAMDPKSQEWIVAQMKMAGYLAVEGANHTFESPGAYPSTMQITVHKREISSKNSFLTFNNSDDITDYVTYDPNKFPVEQDYPVSRRKFTLPIDEDTVLTSKNGAIGRRDFYGFDYFHVLQDQCEHDVAYTHPHLTAEYEAIPAIHRTRKINHQHCIGCD